ncbi:MAG: peptidylprolyl isomerase [Dysgonamonadaceae bacterium]|jgi:peptidyl-prolyl cis-trans isomerase SurA|nr:peptidylprolyl isomerase [Dysgonamonadaceae bacterium]
MKKYFLPLVLLVASLAITAQDNDPVIMTINGKNIKKSEFEYIYNKNNNENAIDKKTFNEYVDLFKNFKLKVAEAETQGLDTTAAFRKELDEYRTQLAKPYLSATEVDQKMLLDEYKRDTTWLEVSHIVLFFPDYQNRDMKLFPADTLAVYKKATEIRNKFAKGVLFEDLVKQYSDDERSKSADRPGYLGWTSGTRILPSLAKGIYSTPVGGISKPIRMNYGYHLINVHAKKADPGEIHAAHILISLPQGADSLTYVTAINKLDTVMMKLQAGVPFETLAQQYSEDPGSANRGGDLSWFGPGMMVPAFNDAAFALKEVGEISEPVQTQFGIHIIKLLGKRSAPSFEDRKADLQTKMERTGNAIALYQPTINKMKKEDGYTFNKANFQPLLTAAQTVYPSDSLFIDRFKNDQNVLFSAANQSYTVADFVEYMRLVPRSSASLSTEVLQEKLAEYEYTQLQQAEDHLLEQKYPEFKNLMQEYHDGILLFEVCNREVWEKSSTDTEGLQHFFQNNASKYTWDQPHYKGYVVLTKDAKTQKQLQKAIAKMDADAAAQYLLDSYKNDGASLFKLEKGLYTQGENAFVDETVFHAGKAKLPDNYGSFFVIGKLLQTPENYTDVRGLVITDYQDYLEKEWLDQLNKKYPVVLYQEVLNTVK